MEQAGDASGTGILDLKTRRFERSLVDSLDPAWFPLLPPVIGPLEIVGKLRKDIAEQFGLSKDVIVAPGSGDNMMSALGSCAIAAGDLVVSLGTSGTVFGTSGAAIVFTMQAMSHRYI